jgi:hypothetical protein
VPSRRLDGSARRPKYSKVKRLRDEEASMSSFRTLRCARPLNLVLLGLTLALWRAMRATLLSRVNSLRENARRSSQTP